MSSSWWSHSKLSLWLKCRRAFRFSFVEDLAPKIEGAPLRRGTLIHAGFEAGILAAHVIDWSTPDPVLTDRVHGPAEERIRDTYLKWCQREDVAPTLEATPELREECDALVDSCVAICRRALFRMGISTGRWETLELDGVPLVEYQLKAELPGGGLFTGTVDWVARDLETGHVWVLDFKTRKQMTPDEDETYNPQLPLYQHLFGLRGLDIQGTGIVQVRAAEPKIPKLTKKGTMARSAISSDWPTYRQAVVEAGLDPDDYLEMKGKTSDFERISTIFRPMAEAEALWHNACDNIALAENDNGDYPMNMGPLRCKQCSFLDLCMAEMRGHDSEYIKENLYTIRTYGYDLAPKDEE